MTIRIWVFITISLAALIASTLWMTSRTSTPPFRDADNRIIAQSIAEKRNVTLGGVEQYVLVRGVDRTAPILVFLHGGPGTSAMAFNRIYNSELEQSFVTVNWDQRGTGKSYDRDADPSLITLDRLSADLDELINQLRNEFDQQKVLLAGHSWGSMLGLHYVSQHPDKVAGFIGIGQMADTPASEAQMYDWVVDQALAAGDTNALAELNAIGAPPYANAAEMMEQRAVIATYGGSWIKPKSDIQYALEVIQIPEFGWHELTTILEGGRVSMDALYDTFTSLKAFESYPSLNVPVYFFEGRMDRVVSPDVAAAYLEALDAPHKELVWFEQSAHSPQWEEPQRYNVEVLRVARELGLLAASDGQE